MTRYGKTMAESLKEVYSLNEDNMDLMKKAAGGSMQTIKFKDGKLKVDSFTASGIMAVYDKVNPKNKKSIENIINSGTKAQIMKLQSLAMKATKKEEVEEDRQLKDPKKEVMVVKKGKVIVIDKKDQAKYEKQGWDLAEDMTVTYEHVQMEGTWGVASTPKEKNQLKKYLSKPFKAKDFEKLYDLIGDDGAFDDFGEYAKKNPNADLRPMMRDWMYELGIFIKEEVELEEVKVGDNVHLGFGAKGGAGFKGKVTKVEKDTVWIKNSKGKEYKGPIKFVTNEEVDLGEATKWKMGDGRPRGSSHIENIRFWDLSKDKLQYIIKDAGEAMKANPTARKAEKWADEVNDANTVLGWRKKNGIKEEVELDEATRMQIQKYYEKQSGTQRAKISDTEKAFKIKNLKVRNDGTVVNFDEEVELDEAIKDYEVKIKVGSKTNSYTIPAKDELSAAQSVLHSVIARSKTGGSPGLAAIRKQYPDMKSLKKKGVSVSIEEEVELDEKFDVKTAATKKGKISVSSFDSLEDAEKHLAGMEKKGHKGIISKNGKPVFRGTSAEIKKQMKAYKKKHDKIGIGEDRQLKDPKKEVMVVKRGKVIVIDKKDQKKYMSKGWELAEEVELEEGKMKDLHALIKQGKSAEEIAKIMKVDAKTIKTLMAAYIADDDKYPEMLKAACAGGGTASIHTAFDPELGEGARADAMRAMRRGKEVDPADVDIDATDDDVKAASKNIIMQMRKVISLRGNFKVEFGDKKKIKIDPKIAVAVQDKYDSLKKPADKQEFTIKISKSYKDMLSALKENFTEEKETILDRIDKKIQERKNG